MAARCQPCVRWIWLAALVSLGSIANATQLQSKPSAGPEVLWWRLDGGNTPFLSPGADAVARRLTPDAFQSDPLLYAASHSHPVARALAAGAQAASPTLPQIKGAFLYNFIRFTEWPVEALPPAAPLVLCVAADATVRQALEEVSRRGAVAGHPLSVRQVSLDGPFSACHLLYVEDLDSRRALRLLEKLDGAPVLSVSDFEGFAQLGGSAHLFVEGGRMRFAVNLDATRRTKLRLSSGLLGLAKIVKDDPNPAGR
jgi:hypothetical protein